jgi:hypothetical protein
VTTFLARIGVTGADRPPELSGRPVSGWAFTGLAVTSFGGPLALAALIAPAVVVEASASAGLVMVAAVALFAFPLVIWLRYARRVNGPGGLYSFVEAAAGRRIALVQAGLWIVSYLLYLVYTTAQIVYDTLPAVLPGERRYQPLLEIAIPVALAGVMIAGRRAALLVAGGLAAGQLVIAAALGGVTAAWLVTAAVLVVAVAPLAADPALTQAAIPGMTAAELFAGHGFAVTVGIGVAVSIAGVMLAEYLALSRLVTAVTSWRLRPVIITIGAVMIAAAPLTLINPARIYTDLIKPSLVALWLSQLIVFVVYPRFAARQHDRRLPAWGLAVVASGFALYGLWITIQHSAT